LTRHNTLDSDRREKTIELHIHADIEGSTVSTGKRLKIGGTYVDEPRFLSDLQSGDPRASDLLISELHSNRKDGRSTGLELLSKAFRGKLMGFLKQMLDGNHEAALEAWNDTLLDIWENIALFDPTKSKFRTWLYNRARYQGLTRRRQLLKEGRLVTDSSVPDVAAPDAMPQPLTATEQVALQRAFRRLNHTQQELLWHRFVEGRMPAEIVTQGLVDNVDASTVSVYINRAAQRLRELYTEERDA
jgi:RNA polymerase sigma-70 factor (ECF subfamily)